MVIYLQTARPLESGFFIKMETFNECTLLALTYLLMCFTDFVPAAETRSDLGLVYIAISLSNMAVHLAFLVAASILLAKAACKTRKLKKQKEKIRDSIKKRRE